VSLPVVNGPFALGIFTDNGAWFACNAHLQSIRIRSAILSGSLVV